MTYKNCHGPPQNYKREVWNFQFVVSRRTYFQSTKRTPWEIIGFSPFLTIPTWVICENLHMPTNEFDLIGRHKFPEN